MNRALLAPLALLALCALAAPGCVAGAPEPPARNAELPAPLPEIRSAAPNPGMVWVPGAWHREGPETVWLPGHWAAPPPVP